MNTIFLRVLEAEDKAAELLSLARMRTDGQDRRRVGVEAAAFSAVLRSPFAYWVSAKVRRLFTELPLFEAEGRMARVGLQTSDDGRFVRAWWEVQTTSAGRRWLTLAKGGHFAPYYGESGVVINWQSQGREMKAFAETTPGTTHWSRNLRNTDLYTRPGLTWPLRGVRFSARAVTSGGVFTIAGKMAFAEERELLWLLALFNSRPFDSFIAFFAGKIGGVQYEVGMIQNIPVPRVDLETRARAGGLARRAWSLVRALDTRTETSHSFALPALLQTADGNIVSRAGRWLGYVQSMRAELAAIQSEIDERCFDLYGIDGSDRHAITEGFAGSTVEDSRNGDHIEEDDDGENAGEEGSINDATALAAELVSWAVGVVFGRFDVRLATGARPMPSEPEPFDPLPPCSPGMLTGDDGLPIAQPPHGYPLGFPESGVLVDDPGHARDLAAAVRAVFDVVFGAEADRWWNDVAALLDPKEHDQRSWLAGSFFEHHLKRYSRSRRKAPIFWQLATPSGRYSVWLYAHRLTRDSFFQLQNDVVGPKLAHEERQLSSLREGAGGSPPASERRAIAAQEALVEELRALLEEVKRVAPLWNPNLDDGVVLTMAPLWRLVPQHRPWQKELKSKWDELAAGKYDWAHVAMHLWPERVVPKCATDRSLAIAHGLEDTFWVEGADGKWKSRPAPLASVDELIREHTSPAANAALKSLLEAPVVGGTGRTTKSGGRPRAAVAKRGEA